MGGAQETVEWRLPAGTAAAVYDRAPYTGRPVFLRLAGELYRLPAQAPEPWWRAVEARHTLRAVPQAAGLSRELHDALLEVLRFWRPELSVLPERAGRLYRALAHAYGEGTPGG